MLVPNYCTEEAFRKAVIDSLCIVDVLESIGINIRGRSQGHYYREFHKTVQALNTSIRHFDSSYKNKELGARARKLSNDELFTLSNKRQDNLTLKKRMIENGFDYKCSVCSLPDIWNGKKITLQIDHIDGNPFNNNKYNLRFICPNCHSQTDTFSGRNIKTSYVVAKPKPSPAPRARKITWPTPEQILLALKTKTYKQLSRELNITDNAIKKYLHSKGFTPPNKQKSNSYLSYTKTVPWPSDDFFKTEVWIKPISEIAKEIKIKENAIHERCKKNGIEKPPVGYWACIKSGQTVQQALKRCHAVE